MAFPKIDMIKTGEKIGSLIKSSGYTVMKIKEMLGISDKSNIYKWIRGESLPTIDNLLALSVLFSVSIEEIIITN